MSGSESGKIPKLWPSTSPGEQEGELGGGPSQKGGQGSLTRGPKSRLWLQPEKDEATGLRKGEVLAQDLKLSSRTKRVRVRVPEGGFPQESSTMLRNHSDSG